MFIKCKCVVPSQVITQVLGLRPRDTVGVAVMFRVCVYMLAREGISLPA
jgi:hypothetical protein